MRKIIRNLLFRKADKKLDEIEFYDLMQTYRHTPISQIEKVNMSFQAVKEFIKKNYS